MGEVFLVREAVINYNMGGYRIDGLQPPDEEKHGDLGYGFNLPGHSYLIN
jgi:hypothetical protein